MCEINFAEIQKFKAKALSSLGVITKKLRKEANLHSHCSKQG